MTDYLSYTEICETHQEARRLLSEPADQAVPKLFDRLMELKSEIARLQGLVDRYAGTGG